MAWEYAGLFDAIVNDSQDDLLADYWKSQPTAIRVGSMGYRTRTTKAGTRLEAEIHPLFGREKEGRLREARKNMTPERQRKQNIQRAKRRLILLLEENFTVWEDIHITLTYAGRDLPGEKQVKRDLRNFLGKVKRLREKRNMPELKYLYAIGDDAENRPHIHLIMNGGLGREELEKIWGHGFANSTSLQEYGNGLQGMANYLFKQKEKARNRERRQTFRSWSGSRNLRKPKEHVSDCKISNRRVKIIAQDFRSQAKEIMEKIYPGYTLENCGVYYSDVVDGVYIRCVMHRKDKGGVCLHSDSGSGRSGGTIRRGS